MVFPQDANPLGTMFGGRVMQIMDVNSAIAAFRFCRMAAVTASSEPIDFRTPISGRSSMIIRSEVYSENPLTGERNLCTIGHMNFVAIGDDSRPAPVPELQRRGETEERHWQEGERVRDHILKRREQAASQDN